MMLHTPHILYEREAERIQTIRVKAVHNKVGKRFQLKEMVCTSKNCSLVSYYQ
jgi:hypothetical protein